MGAPQPDHLCSPRSRSADLRPGARPPLWQRKTGSADGHQAHRFQQPAGYVGGPGVGVTLTDDLVPTKERLCKGSAPA
jgi:hypothetical protein